MWTTSVRMCLRAIPPVAEMGFVTIGKIAPPVRAIVVPAVEMAFAKMARIAPIVPTIVAPVVEMGFAIMAKPPFPARRTARPVEGKDV